MRSPNPLGIMDKDATDVKPTRTIFYVTDKKAFKKLTRLARKRLFREVVPLGRALTTDEAEQFYSYINIPDDAADDTTVPNFLTPSHIENPEEEAIKRFDFDNVVDVPEGEVQAIIDNIARITSSSKDVLYAEILAPIIAFDNARSTVEAVMRDNLGIKGRIDSTVTAALDDVSKLALISHFIENTPSINADVKQNYLLTLSDLLAQNTVLQMAKNARTEVYSSVLQSMATRKTNEDVDIESKPMAAMRRKSVPPNKQ